MSAKTLIAAVAALLILSAWPAYATQNVRDFGAIGDGVTDDYPAFQAAQNAMSSSANDGVFIPCGIYYLSSSVLIGNTGFNIQGENPACARILIKSNIPAFLIDNTVALQAGNFEKLTCLFVLDGSWTACLTFLGTTTGAYIQNSTFANIRCFGANTCIRNARNVNVGGEAQFDWNLFSNIQTANLGPYQTHYAIYTDNGSGTGNVYTNMNLITDQAGLYWRGANLSNIGDITIDSIQIGGGGSTGFYFQGGASYRSRITISNVQCDAGAIQCVVAPGYDRLTLSGVTLGGGVGNNIAGATNIFCGSLVC